MAKYWRDITYRVPQTNYWGHAPLVSPGFAAYDSNTEGT